MITINLFLITLSFFNYYFNIYNFDFSMVYLIKTHILSYRIFMYTIYISSLLEIVSYLFNYYNEYLLLIPYLDDYVVLTSLNILTFTGFQITKKKYISISEPNYIKNTIMNILYLGMFWIIVDKNTQYYKINNIFYIRFIINLITNLFIIRIYNMMKYKKEKLKYYIF